MRLRLGLNRGRAPLIINLSILAIAGAPLLYWLINYVNQDLWYDEA